MGSIENHTSLRERATRGERLLGTVVASPDIALCEMLAAHFDFVWIDLEHSPLTLRDVQSLCIAARAAGCATLVRVPDAASAPPYALLDIGVDGLIAPRVEDVTIAARFAAGLRYPPDGSRGFAHRRFTAYGLAGAPESPRSCAPLCLLQVESAAAVARAEELARVEGVDGLVIGPSDLALDLGVSEGLRSSELAAAIAAVQAAAADAGVISGIAVGGDVEMVVSALGESSTLLAYSADVLIYARAIAAAAEAVGRAWGGGGAQA